MNARRTVRCFYYEPVKSELLRSAFLPAVHDARAAGLRAHVERHWLHGPHLALCLEGPRRSVAELEVHVTRLLRSWLSEHPSATRSTPGELLAQSETAGQAELVPGPYEPIVADNTVTVGDTDETVLAELLGRTALDCRRVLLERGVAVLDTLGDTASSGARVRTAVSSLVAHAASYPLGIAGGYLSFVSHVEDFLFLHDPTGAVRRSFDAVFDSLDFDLLDLDAGAWGSWSRHAQEICDAAYRSGDIPLLPGDGYSDRAVAMGGDSAWRWHDDRTQFSDFHRALAEVDYLDEVHDSFGPYRFSTNVLYQLLLLCDVRPLERYLAAHLLGRAVQRRRGRTWQQDLADAAGGRA